MKTSNKRRKRARHEGITLIELLIVIFIMMIITAIAIPMMIPSIEERRLRETSRLVTSHLQGARTRAIQTGKRFGVMIEPQGNLPAAGISLSYMAEAPPWRGDFNSQAHVIGNLPGPESYTDQDSNGQYDLGEPYTDTNGNSLWDSGGGPYALLDNFIDASGTPATNTNYGLPVTEGWKGLVRPGDRIRFNGGGNWFLISSGEPFTDSNSNGAYDNTPTPEPFADLDGDTNYDPPDINAKGFLNNLPWTLTHPTGGVIPSSGYTDVDMSGMYNQPPDYLSGASFEVSRQPTRTAAHPFQLPNAMVVDLESSGTSGIASLRGLGPITVLFTPTGALHSIYYYQNNRAVSASFTSPLYLLVGKIENLEAGKPANFQDLTNFWVTIHPQTGLITSTPIPGPEPFVDANNNGQRETSEAYTDLNNNGVYDGSERYTDVNANGIYDAPPDTQAPADDTNSNGKWDRISLGQSRFFAERALTLGGR